MGVGTQLFSNAGTIAGYFELKSTNTSFQKKGHTIYDGTINPVAWSGTALINTINLIPSADNFNENCVFILYGRI
jgi:hypothetical protein